MKPTFRETHPFVIAEPEPRRRFASAECAAATAYELKTTFVDEQTRQLYTWADVLRLAPIGARSTH